MSYGLTLITPPTNEPVSLAQMKLHSRVVHDHEDSVIESFIKAARIYCESFLRRQLHTATWRLSLDAFPAVIKLPLPPLQSVSEITYVDSAGVTQVLDPSKYIVDAASQPARIVPAYGQCWPLTRCQPNAVTITFVAGYTQVPETIKAAIKLLAGHWFENRESASPQSMNEIPFGVESLLLSEQWGSL